MINIREEYKKFCESKGIKFSIVDKVNPYDDTTLFCSSGMHQFKKKFSSDYIGTESNIQSCIRMNDFEEVGDKTHFLYFNMIGLFSFKQMSVKEAIDFWIEFLTLVGIKLDYVTIHPDKMEDWGEYYKEYNLIIKPDKDCTWSDGEIRGYCTEFYVNGIEIGNIVNPLGHSIDVGFGEERLNMVVNGITKTKDEILDESVLKIIESGYVPSNLKQGYILRKLLREIYKNGKVLNHPYFTQEIERQKKIIERYNKLKDKHKDKNKEWWYGTHGINIDEM